MYIASFQIVAGVLRVGQDHEFGLPWEYCAFVSSHDGLNVTVLGLKGDGKFTAGHAWAMRRKLRQLGFKTIHWDRKKACENAKHLQF
jgi:hypothetical protein